MFVSDNGDVVVGLVLLARSIIRLSLQIYKIFIVNKYPKANLEIVLFVVVVVFV